MSESIISSKVAEPYAQALMSLAQSQNLTESFGESFRSLESLMEESPDFKDFIANPVIDGEDKKAVLKQVMGEGENPYLISFLMLLVDKRRVVFLEQIVGQYLSLLRELNQVALAEVISAKELSDEQKNAVVDRVKGITNSRDVELKTSIDSDLIGGVIIKVGSQVIDASIRGQLRRLSVSLGS